MVKLVQSLKSDIEFEKVLKNGRSFVNKYYVLYVLPTGKPYNKIAFCAGKKLGNAVRRNRIRRRIRGAFLEIANHILSGYALILIARASIYEEEFQVLLANLKDLFLRAGIYKCEEL